MPSPAAHVLGGIAAAFLIDSTRRRHSLTPTLLAASAAAAMTPDLDLLFASHRTYTHSVGAVFLVGAATWLFMAMRARTYSLGPAAILMSAYGSHLLLDWTGKDTSNPPGLMIAWPFSFEYHVSGWNLFGEVSRRYWLPREFILWNLQAFAWEMLVLVPVLLLAWVTWSRRTLEGVGKG